MESMVVTSRRGIASRVKEKWRNIVGWSLERLRSPALLKHFEYVDPATNETIYLYTSPIYSVLCVGSRRFYFDRITGQYDGTSALPDGVAGRVELPD
jgi:hypothetical protein